MAERPFTDFSYEQYLNEERLMGSICRKCGKLFVPPRPICVRCYDPEMKWVEMTGKGRLVAFTCITVCPPFMMEQGYNRDNPYCLGVVELEEGARVDGRIEGVDPRRPEAIEVGMPLAVTFLHRAVGDTTRTSLAFKPS
jgi:uncharacterized OB-fold protein